MQPVSEAELLGLNLATPYAKSTMWRLRMRTTSLLPAEELLRTESRVSFVGGGGTRTPPPLGSSH